MNGTVYVSFGDEVVMASGSIAVMMPGTFEDVAGTVGMAEAVDPMDAMRDENLSAILVRIAL